MENWYSDVVSCQGIGNNCSCINSNNVDLIYLDFSWNRVIVGEVDPLLSCHREQDIPGTKLSTFSCCVITYSHSASVVKHSDMFLCSNVVVHTSEQNTVGSEMSTKTQRQITMSSANTICT